MGWPRKFLIGVLSLLLFFATASVAHAEELVPSDEPAPPPAQVESTHEVTRQFCPFVANIQNECGKESYTADGLFGPEGGVEAWSKDYSRVDRCKLWWWADHVQTWQYAPLTEWSTYMKDALMENMDRGIIFDTIGLAPVPPYPKLNDKDRPTTSCQVPTGQDWVYLSEKLRRLNLANVTPETLYAFVKGCLAFEVEASVWKRISTTVIASYVLPIGDMNFIILAQTRVTSSTNPYKDRPEALREAKQEVGVDFTTVGACPVSKDPRNCVEELIREQGHRSTFGFSKGYVHQFGALPFRPDVDSLYSGGGIDGPLDMEMQVQEDGNTYFFLLHKNSTRSRVTLALGEDGGLAFNTDERVCDPDNAEGRKLQLRPIAFADRVKKLYKELAAYGSWDFPETKRNATSGIEKGCKSGKSYSEWAAETANAAKHYAYHGMPWDTLFRSTAHQRYKWSLKARGIPQIRDNLVYGLWRKDAQETPLIYGSTFENQAAAFARKSSGNAQEPAPNSITYRTIMIDEIPATEVWYYAKPISFWPGQDIQGRVIINHLKNYNEIYSRSVIAKLTQLSTTCGDLKSHKRGFLAAMYALFNASPLQKGNEIVSKAFMAGAYHHIFGYKIRAMKKLIEIDFDAQTMGLDQFIEKYLPLI